MVDSSNNCDREQGVCQCVLQAHVDSPVKVRSKEGPSHLCSSPPAYGETWALKRGVKPSLGGCNSPVRSIKRSLPRRKPEDREPSLVAYGEGQERGEALGSAAPKNPVAYGTWNGERANMGTGEVRLHPDRETLGKPTQDVDREQRTL